ncbi:MAG: porin, partial [Rhodocyclaceae bacterium]|nr:porin [Rhodocyclaceae bacterium]
MQKKIIALAVAGLMSGAAFAQTNVVISGLLDVGLNNAKAEGKSASNNAAYNNAGTSNITFRAQEDLGGGLKAGALVESNILASNGTGSALFGSFQKYVFVGGGFGELSFGQRTNFSVTAATTAQPFGTALGGGYSGAFGRLRGDASNATGGIVASSGSGNRDVRADGSIRYDSPNFQGFTAGLSYKPKNAGATTETTASTGHMNIGLNYGVGPMKVSYAYAKISNTGLG